LVGVAFYDISLLLWQHGFYSKSDDSDDAEEIHWADKSISGAEAKCFVVPNMCHFQHHLAAILDVLEALTTTKLKDYS